MTWDLYLLPSGLGETRGAAIVADVEPRGRDTRSSGRVVQRSSMLEDVHARGAAGDEALTCALPKEGRNPGGRGGS